MYGESDRARDLAGEREKELMQKGEKKCNFDRRTGKLSWTWTYNGDSATYDINKRKWVA